MSTPARQLVRVCADGCGPDFIWPETPEHCSNCGAATVERETAESQRDRYREALERVAHGDSARLLGPTLARQMETIARDALRGDPA
jgi:hypothetical protein